MRWKRLPKAIAPDKIGQIWSGSAVVDEENQRMVAFFTYSEHETKRQSQGVAFSYDKGRTWEKYSGNPILTDSREDFRDPKVFRYEEKWVMILSGGDCVLLYESKDLIHWNQISSFKGKTMHHTCKTIQRYLSPDYSVEDGHYNARIPGKLAPYEAEVIKLRSEGMTYPNIHKIITEKGYKGSVASLRMFIQKERIRNEAHLSQQETCSDYQSKEYIQRRSLIQLIYKGLSDVKTITKTQYEQVLKTYPVITELYAAIKEFYEILYSRRDERLETWLEKIENFNIPELQTYVNGIRIDINAVKNGIKLKYNNGLAEGSVNKIKVIKRIMYGRNSFDLLKVKVLLHEHFRCEFN